MHCSLGIDSKGEKIGDSFMAVVFSGWELRKEWWSGGRKGVWGCFGWLDDWFAKLLAL